MKQIVDDALVERLGRLAELRLEAAERRQAKRDLEEMIGFLDRLDQADVEGLEPLYQVLPVENILREDVESAQSNVEGRTVSVGADGYFAVPRTFGG